MRNLARFTFWALFVLCSVSHGSAENLFVRAGATGLNNGSDWNNAWRNFSSVQWGSGSGKVGPGDTLWVAGGTYTDSIRPGASGTDVGANSIFIKRVRATDPVSSVAGWTNSFDAQVVVNAGDNNAVNLITAGSGSYLTIDGRVDSGIKLICPNNSGASVRFGVSVNFLTLTNIDLAGPGGPSPIIMNGDNRCIDATAWDGTAYQTIDHLRISNCRLHGCVNLLWLYNVNNSTIEYCKLYDSAAANSATFHANVCAAAGCKNMTWRYNDIANWQVEGIMWIFGGSQDWYIYGNVWHDGMGGPIGNAHRILEAQDGVEGPVYFYNNTVVNVLFGIRTANGGTYAPGSQGRNNIYWNNGGPGLPSDDYDYANSPLAEIHGLNSSIAPFVNLGAQNYHLLPGSAPFLARNKGVVIANLSGQTFNLDLEGNTRGNDGAWDIGAYESTAGGLASTNPVVAVYPASQTFDAVTIGTTNFLTFTVQNIGGGILAGSASVPPPFGIVSPAAYSLSGAQSQTIKIAYSPSGALTDTQLVTFSGGGGAMTPVSGTFKP